MSDDLDMNLLRAATRPLCLPEDPLHLACYLKRTRRVGLKKEFVTRKLGNNLLERGYQMFCHDGDDESLLVWA